MNREAWRIVVNLSPQAKRDALETLVRSRDKEKFCRKPEPIGTHFLSSNAERITLISFWYPFIGRDKQIIIFTNRSFDNYQILSYKDFYMRFQLENHQNRQNLRKNVISDLNWCCFLRFEELKFRKQRNSTFSASPDLWTQPDLWTNF